MKLYEDDELVGALTNFITLHGISVFQLWQHGGHVDTHVSWLLQQAKFKQGATVLDVGCGVGMVATLMNLKRPDLRFSLQNISSSQLKRCPPWFTQYEGPMDKLAKIVPQQFDYVMVCYALGHVESMDEFLDNVWEVLKPGGELFVYDIGVVEEHREWMLRELGYTYYKDPTHKSFTVEVIYPPREHFELAKGLTDIIEPRVLQEIRDRTFPVVYKLIKN